MRDANGRFIASRTADTNKPQKSVLGAMKEAQSVLDLINGHSGFQMKAVHIDAKMEKPDGASRKTRKTVRRPAAKSKGAEDKLRGWVKAAEAILDALKACLAVGDSTEKNWLEVLPLVDDTHAGLRNGIVGIIIDKAPNADD